MGSGWDSNTRTKSGSRAAIGAEVVEPLSSSAPARPPGASLAYRIDSFISKPSQIGLLVKPYD